MAARRGLWTMRSYVSYDKRVRCAQMQLNERHLCVQERRSELLAVESEVVRQLQLLRGWQRPCSQSAFHAGQLPEDAVHAALLNARAHG